MREYFTGYNFRACLDEDNDDQVFTLDSCPADRVIYIASAVAWHGYYITWTESNSRCDIARVTCREHTYHQEITRCNGHRDCSITRNVFNQKCYINHVNAIDITYICLKGKSTICTYYGSAFRVYFMICSCRISSSKNCKY